jgi:uncharacterized protein
MREQAFEVVNEGMTIRGMSYLPADGDAGRPYPALLLLHGLGGDRIELAGLFLHMAEFLTARGFAVITFNFRHTPDSDGQLCDLVPSDELSDALCMAAWSRQRDYVDSARLGLLGISLGGLIAACTVARTDMFKCLVLLNPTDVWNMRRLAGLYKDPPADVFMYGSNRLSPRFCDDAATLDPLGDVMKFKGPTLLVQGARDGAVELPVSDRYAYSRRRAGLPVDQRVIDIGNHAFSSAEQHALLYPIIADWLDEHLP